MKKYHFSTLLIFLTAITSFNISAVTTDHVDKSIGGTGSLLIIDAYDSVFFDLFQASIVGSVVEVPVYIKSDDIINAIDFSFKYDQVKLEYDTILFMAPYIEGLSFYNQNDSVVRLTSYSFTQPYANDSLLFKIRFTLLSGNQICAGDLNTVEALLNGDACTASVTDCLTGVGESPEIQRLEIFPNPATNFINLRYGSDLNAEIYDMNGRLVNNGRYLQQNGRVSIPVDHLIPGSYVIRLRDQKNTVTRRFLKAR